MITAQALATTQQRLARHYLNKLRIADEAVRRGKASFSYGHSLFEQEWEQIRHWQSWAVRNGTQAEASVRLCLDFSLAGLEVLANHTSSVDYVLWLERGLDAAQELHDDEAERILSYELLLTYYRLGMLEKIEHFANQLLKLGEAAKDLLSIERAFFGLGTLAEERGLFAEAEAYYQRALQLARELGIDREIGQALNGLGTVATYLGDYQKASPYFLRQLELMETTGKKSEVCHALLSMGGVLLWRKDYASAEAYLQRAAAMSRALGLRRLLGVSLIHLGSSALEQNQMETAYRYLDEGLEEVRSVGVVRQIMTGLSLLGYTCLRMGDPTAALAHLQEGLEMAHESGMPRIIRDLQCNLAKTYLVLNDLDSARSALKEVLTLAQNLGGHPQKVEAVSIAVAYDQYLGRHEQAAIWAGTMMGDAELDNAFVMSIYVKLEAALGSETYQLALAQGKTRSLDDVVAEILQVLS